jgi:integrase/recombinase XerD
MDFLIETEKTLPVRGQLSYIRRMETPALDITGQGGPFTVPLPRRKRETALRLVPEDLPNGERRWMLLGLYVDGKRKRERFTNEDSAKRRLQMLLTARENTGTLARRIEKNPEHAADAGRAADLLAPLGLTLLDAVREYVLCREKLTGTGKTLLDAAKDCAARDRSRRESLTLAALVARFMADPETVKRSKPYLDDVRKRWRRFQDHLGSETLACDVTPDAVRRWLAALPVSDLTKGNFHRTVGAVLSYAVHAELVAENPFRKVRKPEVKGADGVDVFTPEQMGALLAAAHEDWLPVLSIGGFAGLRPEELRRLDWEEVDVKGGFIEVKASKSKTGKRRLVTISKNLRAWLLRYEGRTGRIVTPRERKHRIAAMAAAGVKVWPMDVLRHSFASYHLRNHGNDLNLTAQELGHTTTKMLFQHYREAVKPDAAKAWWALMPESAKGAKVILFKAAKHKAAVA